MGEEHKISPAILIGAGLAIGTAAAAAGIYALARAAGKVFASSVYDEQGTGLWGGALTNPIIMSFRAIDPEFDGKGGYALGKPDGLPALIQGYEGNFLSLWLFSKATHIQKIKVRVESLYAYGTSVLFGIDISPDGTTWERVAIKGPSPIPPGSSIYEAVVNKPVLLVRVTQSVSGVALGVDAVEVER